MHEASRCLFVHADDAVAGLVVLQTLLAGGGGAGAVGGVHGGGGGGGLAGVALGQGSVARIGELGGHLGLYGAGVPLRAPRLVALHRCKT
jgi:hypothetical protein